MTAYVSTEDSRPMFEMNTTPLIDVMLVLLVMFIITIPIQSHAVKIDLPAAVPTAQAINPVKNLVQVDRLGMIRWNGAPVSKSGLAYNLERSLRMAREPELHVRPDALAPYVVVDEVLAVSKRSGVTKLGFVGNEAYRHTF